MNTGVTMKKSNGIKKQVRKKPFDVLAKILLETNNKEVIAPIFFGFIFLFPLNKFFDQRTSPVLGFRFKIKPSFEVKIKKFSVIKGLK